MSPLRSLVAATLSFVGAVSSVHATAIFAVGTGTGCGYATIQQAVDAERTYAGANDIIYVSRTLTYSAQAIYIHDQSLTIIGGVDNCNDYTPSGTTTVSGSGGAAVSVVTIRGTTNVRMSYLTVTNGDDTSDNVGGGIDFQGQGKVWIDHSRIFNNLAGFGGGINFNGTGIGGQLYIEGDTFISANTANTSGGGIRMEGKSELQILQPQTFIANNSADGGYGGGLLVLSPARADLGSPGYQGVGMLYGNSAQYGGGLAVISNSPSQNAIVRLFTTDPLQPQGIESNAASISGGGIFLQAYIGDGEPDGDARICGSDYHIAANSAPDGSAITVHDGTLGRTGINFAQTGSSIVCDGTDSVAALGAKLCTSKECYLIEDNVAQNISGQATDGSTVLLQSSGQLDADRIRLSGNSGGHAIRMTGGGNYETSLTVSNCLLDDNVATGDFVTADGGSDIFMTNCTIAGNEIDSGVVMRAVRILRWKDSIVAQSGSQSLVYTGGNPAGYLTLDYLLSAETATLAQGTHITQGDPLFVNAVGGDFRLRPTSPAIDRAPPVVGDDRDLDNKPHDQDIGSVPNGDGVRDLGAYERQTRYCGAADTLFCDTFGFD